MNLTRREFIINLPAALLISTNYRDPIYESLVRPAAAEQGDVVIGVGNSSLADSRHDIDLLGNLTYYKEARFMLDEGKLIAEAFFDFHEANFEWSEVALFIHGICARRKQIPTSPKTSHEQRKAMVIFDS